MKKIEAIIKPFRLYEVRDALGELGFEGMTIIEVQGTGRQRGETEMVRGDEDPTELLPKVKLELVVSDRLADRAVSVIIKSARTGKIGDGKVFVSTIDRAIRIRTGEENEAAI
jgi:nitrogen regulatory protein P-II 1